MKISKSKQELARIISENGGWRDKAESAAQCRGGEISFWHDTATKQPGTEWCGSYLGKKHDIEFTGVKLPNWHQTILSRDEYFHLYPSQDVDGWIEWKGGSIDIDDLQLVDYKMRCTPQGSHLTTESMNLVWDKTGEPFDIIAYRLHKPEQVEIVEYNGSGVVYAGPVQSEFVVTEKPTIEQLATDYRNAKDYAERKQQEADDAKADAEAKLKSLELAGEAHGLLVTPITAKQEPELVITDLRDLRVGDEVKASYRDIAHITGKGN